jgi:hypothetical protein
MGDDKKRDGIGVLSKVSGLKREKIDQIWLQVKENMKLLEACSLPHEFVDENKDGKMARYSVCRKCGGRVDKLHAMWYRKGLKDAKR